MCITKLLVKQWTCAVLFSMPVSRSFEFDVKCLWVFSFEDGICLANFLHVFISLSLSLSLSLSHYVLLCISLSSSSLCRHVCLSPPLSLYVCLSICMSVSWLDPSERNSLPFIIKLQSEKQINLSCWHVPEYKLTSRISYWDLKTFKVWFHQKVIWCKHP